MANKEDDDFFPTVSGAMAITLPHSLGDKGDAHTSDAITTARPTASPTPYRCKDNFLSAVPVTPTTVTNAPPLPAGQALMLDERATGSETNDAALLLSVAAIATKEIYIDGSATVSSKLGLPTFGTKHDTERLASVVSNESKVRSSMLSPRFSQLCSVFEDEYQHEMEAEEPYSGTLGNRARTVSLDSHLASPVPDSGPSQHSQPCFGASSAAQVSPPNSPLSSKGPRKPRKCLQAEKSRLAAHLSNGLLPEYAVVSPGGRGTSSGDKPLQPQKLLKGKPVKTILRKKFSWKNYPELEAFLIANREEYLRHSALNYTVQQKQYNNRLTERLLELAAEHGYVFDSECFSFVTVRDRIRCYFKSYVQSSKKRGVIIGYAARRAGLLSEVELERSAGIEGRIVLPSL